MEFSGQANAKELAGVFQMVASATHAGRLTVASGERRLSFYFSPDGVTLLSNGHLKSAELAAELVGEQFITAADAEAALVEQERTGGSLGEILARRGAIPQEGVPDLVLRQLEEELLGLCTWEHGTFEFADGPLPAEVRDQFRFATNFAFNPEQLLVNAARRLDEWRLIEERIPSGSVIFTTAPAEGAEAVPPPVAADAAADDRPADLPSTAVTAVSVLVDGVRTADEIIEAAHFPRFEVFRVLRHFLDTGRIRPATIEELLDTARGLTKQREFARAARLYAHLALLRPTDAVMRLKAGQLYERLGDPAQALAEYRRAVEILLASEMPSQATAVVDAMKALDPEDLFALETSVNVSLAQGEVGRAATDARRAIDLLVKRGDLPGAVKYGAIAADLAPQDLSVRRLLVTLLLKTDQPARAADELEQIAALLRERHETGPLLRVLQEIRALDPTRPIVRSAFGRSRRSAGAESSAAAGGRRWGRVAVVSTVSGLLLAALAFVLIYEAQARAAFRAVQQNAEDLARHHRYHEAAALLADLARQFRHASIVSDAEESRQNVLARGRRYAALQVRDGGSAVDRLAAAAQGTVQALVDEAQATLAAADVQVADLLAAAALYAQAHRLESQAKYPDAHDRYAELVRKYPDLSVYGNIELPVMIESVPLGAKILINDREVGVTPLLVRHPPFAAWRVVLQQPGFTPFETTLETGGSMRLAAELPRKPAWVFRTAGPVESGVAIDGARVFCGSRDGHVYALNAETGQLIWKYHTGALGDVTAAPVVAGRTLFVGSHDGHLYALDSATGRLRWRFRTGQTVEGRPCFFDQGRALAVGSNDRNVYALSVEDGRRLWEFRADGPVVASPALAGDLVLVGSLDRNVYALSTTDGRVRWRFETGGAVTAAPVALDGAVYVGADDGHLYILDGASGRVRARLKTGGPIESAPCVRREPPKPGAEALAPAASADPLLGQVVYVGSTDGAVYAWDAARAAPRWKFATQGAIRGAPVADDRFLYVGSADHSLYVLDLASGTLCWKAKTGGIIAAAPALLNDLLYLGSGDQALYAFRLPTAAGG
jgi:outer membrane protein assembly factor BamB/tetratricopeptide (TPR) repeat protein